MEKVSKRESAIQEVKESVSLLSQLLQGFSRESSSQSNQELVKVSAETQHIGNRLLARSPPRSVFALPTRVCFSFQDLYQRCEKMRPTLFRLASDTEDSDEALGERASLTRPIVRHKKALYEFTFNQLSLFFFSFCL